MPIDGLLTQVKKVAKRILTPSVVQIEPTRRCNFHCAHCNHRQDTGTIDLATYEAILDRHRDCKIVKLQGLGEPLLHPEIQQLIDIAKGRGHQVMVITNGSQRFVNNVDHYVFSLETMDPQLYQAIGKDNLAKVLENIRYVAARQKVTINCVQCSATIPADVSSVQAFARELGAGLWVTPQEVWVDPAHADHAAQEQSARLAWKIHGTPDGHRKYRACTWGLNEFYYDWTGAPHPCCIRMTDEYRGQAPNQAVCRRCPL